LAAILMSLGPLRKVGMLTKSTDLPQVTLTGLGYR